MNPQSKLLEETLSKPDFHDKWVNAYYGSDNARFYELAFGNIFQLVVSKGSCLDAGCGNGIHSIQLTKMGFSVTAVDFSEAALELARKTFAEQGVTNIKLQRENLTGLSFHNSQFDCVLCWGVLMHIPDVEKAVSELCRVIKPGGFLIVSENNMNSVQSLFTYGIRKYLLRSGRINKDKAGIEFWKSSDAGELLARKCNMTWLETTCRDYLCELIDRRAGQFSSAYTWVHSRLLRSLILSFNELWFTRIKLPYFAEGNILVFRKSPPVKTHARTRI